MSRHRSLRDRFPRILPAIAAHLVLLLFVAGNAAAQTPPPDSIRKVKRDSAAGVLILTEAERKAEYGRLLAAIERAQVPSSIPDSASMIAMRDVRSLVAPADEAELMSALQRHEADVSALRQALQRNEMVRSMLESLGIPMSEVVALDTSSKPGRATLYYWPRE